MDKICFYCDSIFSFGGVQRVLAVIANGLSADYEITILTHDRPEQIKEDIYGLKSSNITFRYISMPPIGKIGYLPCKVYSFLYKKKYIPQVPITSQWYGYSSFPASQRKVIIRELNNGNYDVIVGVHAFLSLRLASIRHQLKSPKVVGWMHSSYTAFFETPGFYLYEQKKQFCHEMPKLDDIIVLTNSDRIRYQKELGLSPLTIYNPLTLVPKGKGSLQQKQFLSVGRMSYQTKGFDILIEAFALLAMDNKDWTLNIVGEGPEEPKLRALIASHKLEDRITISPFTTDVQKHYARASIYILSSRWEGFALVVPEAMSHGLPVIASDLPAMKEMLQKQENHFLFTNGDVKGLAMVMKKATELTPEHWNQMSESSLELSRSFSPTDILRQWKEILKTQKNGR